MPARSPTRSRPDGGRCGRTTPCGCSPKPTAEKAPSTRSRPPFPARSGITPDPSPGRTGRRHPGEWLELPGKSRRGGTGPDERAAVDGGARPARRDNRRARGGHPRRPGSGAGSLVIGLGGSASTDGGAGALRALGLVLRDAEGAPWPAGRRRTRPGGVTWIAGTCWRRHLAESPCSPTSARRSPARTEPPRCSGRRRAPPPTQIALLDAALAHFAIVARRRPRPSGHGSRGRLRLRLRRRLGRRGGARRRLHRQTERPRGGDRRRRMWCSPARAASTRPRAPARSSANCCDWRAVTASRPASSPGRYPPPPQ